MRLQALLLWLLLLRSWEGDLIASPLDNLPGNDNLRYCSAHNQAQHSSLIRL